MESRLLATGLALLVLSGCGKAHALDADAGAPPPAEVVRDVDVSLFRVEHPEKIAGRCILLVDDVLTTGTTASECARVLRKAGAEKVWVATVARTLKHSGSNFAVEPDFDIAAQAS